MKLNTLIFMIIFCFFSNTGHAVSSDQVDFDGEIYKRVWSTEIDGVLLVEYLRDGETVKKWNQMLSVQIHPNAKRIADVMNPYAAARKEFYLSDVRIYEDKSGEDMIFEFLLAPNKSYVEFVLLRAFSNPNEPVILYILSVKLKPSDKETFKKALAKRADWFDAFEKMDVRPDLDK